MRGILSSAIVLTALMFITSCQKEIDWTPDSLTQGDSSYLAKVVYLDTTQPAGADTFQIGHFSYDNAKRLSRILTYFDYVGAIDTFIYDFRYNGTDSLPYLIVERVINYNGPGTSVTDSLFYTYSNGTVTKDSSVQWIYPSNTYDATLVYQFVTAGSTARVYIREYTYLGPVFTLINSDSAIYTVSLNAGNITTQTYADGGVAFYNSVQAGYDGKPNPFRKIVKARFPCFENCSFNGYGSQPNNPLQVQYDRFFISDDLQYTYKYRTDGFPVSGTLFSSSGLNDYNKVLYSYTTL